jgi:hypothetical protein
VTAKVIPFNPLDKKNLGASVAEALLAREPVPLSQVPVFEGAGIYAIYYDGPFEAYERLSKMNQARQFLLPIYVGKAIPAGARIGASQDLPAGRVLSKRLKEHAESINACSNLDIDNFFCRFLIVDDIWIPLGESLIISRFTPLWNSLIDGFGNHNPGRGRHAGMRPRWDVLHPGRSWAMSLAERPETQDQIARDAARFLDVLPPSISPQFVRAPE